MDEFRSYLGHVRRHLWRLQRTAPPLEEALRPKPQPQIETRVIRETVVQPAPPTVVEHRTLVGVWPLALAVLAAVFFLLLWLLSLTRASEQTVVYVPAQQPAAAPAERPTERTAPTEASIVSSISPVRTPIAPRPTPTRAPLRATPTPLADLSSRAASCSRDRIPLYARAEFNIEATGRIRDAFDQLTLYSDRFKLIEDLGGPQYILRDVRVYSVQGTVDQLLDFYRSAGSKGDCIIERDLGIERFVAIRDLGNTFAFAIEPFGDKDLSALGIHFEGFILAAAEKKAAA